MSDVRKLQVAGKLGGSGLPEGGSPHQQLVIDAEGNAKWEGRAGGYDLPAVEALFYENEECRAETGYIFDNNIVEGGKYIVDINGEIYECTAFAATAGITVNVIGNPSFVGLPASEANEPFMVAVLKGELIVYSDITSYFSIRITSCVAEAVKFPSKYIPAKPAVTFVGDPFGGTKEFTCDYTASELYNLLMEHNFDLNKIDVMYCDMSGTYATFSRAIRIQVGTHNGTASISFLMQDIDGTPDRDVLVYIFMNPSYEIMTQNTSGVLCKMDYASVAANADYSELKGKYMIYNGGGNISVGENPIPTPTTAAVGQTLVVKAVDENGKPTEWECVDVEEELPTVTTSDAGKFLRVSADGAWAAETIPNAEGASF